MLGKVPDGIDIEGEEIAAKKGKGVVCGDVFCGPPGNRDEGKQNEENQAHEMFTLA